eukprot:6920088-Prymnesium_polylepis.1
MAAPSLIGQHPLPNMAAPASTPAGRGSIAAASRAGRERRRVAGAPRSRASLRAGDRTLGASVQQGPDIHGRGP